MNEILSRYFAKFVKRDQKARRFVLNSPKPLRGLSKYIIYLIDYLHNRGLHKIIKRHGYPSQKLIGERGMRDFWLLVQHQDFDPELQKACLKHCDFQLKEKAYLTDRVLVNAGQKQLYGTQFYRDERGILIPRPIEDKKNMDKRREAVGLESFQIYQAKMRKEFTS